MKTILVVEDDKLLGKSLKSTLDEVGYTVIWAQNSDEVFEALSNNEIDLIYLDIMLPGVDGYELIKAIKDYDKSTPVIFMSARNEELDRVVGLELGSDDYLSKPFLPRELVIRTNKLMERVYGAVGNEPVKGGTALGDYRISKNQRTVFLGSEEIQLTNKEFELLNYFAENRNNVVSREQILNNVWGDDYFGSDRVVDDTIRRLRKKVDKLNIETVYGYGYKLVLKQ
jgi:two-component system response regulator CssR